MANALYDSGRNAFLLGDIDWVADDIRMVLVDAADYAFSLSTHAWLSEIPAGARVATVALTGKTATAGVADAADATFTAVTGDPSEYLIIYKHTGTEATSQLIAFIDTATGLPVIPNGGDIATVFDNGPSKIFVL